VPGRFRGALGALDAHGLALLSWADQTRRRGELCVEAPPDNEAIGRRLMALVQDWAAAGRPSDADLRISAYPRGAAPAAPPNAVAIDERWTTFLLEWASPQQA
jgi:hypothetical protein